MMVAVYDTNVFHGKMSLASEKSWETKACFKFSAHSHSQHILNCQRPAPQKSSVVIATFWELI